MFEEYRSELKKQSKKAEQSRRDSVPAPKSTTEVKNFNALTVNILNV